MTIEIREYDASNPWAASVAPDDRAWVLFVPRASETSPSLWLRTPEGYVPAQVENADAT